MLRTFFQNNRVRFAQITFYSLFFYCFFFRTIEIPPLDSASGILGLLLATAGVAMRALAAGVIHKNQTLATSGVYALARHPLYAGSLLIAVGLAIIIRDPLFSMAMIGLFLFTYLPTIAAEEERMAKLFPQEWPAYAASTPRLVPRLTAIGQLKGLNWDMGLWRRNREYQALVMFLLILAFLQGYSHFTSV